MKKLLTFILCFQFLNSFGQIGVIGGFKTLNAAGWNEEFQNQFQQTPYPVSGAQIGLTYWFRLKNRRIEFAPELSAVKFKSVFEEVQFQHNQFSFFFNTDFYIFDLKSDCNCPTWSKEGNMFSKGFFIELAPGISAFHNKYTSSMGENKDGDEFTFGGALGVGLDLGVTDLFTITPVFRYFFYPKVHWNYALTKANDENSVSQVFIGLRLRAKLKEFNSRRFH